MFPDIPPWLHVAFHLDEKAPGDGLDVIYYPDGGNFLKIGRMIELKQTLLSWSQWMNYD